MINTRQTRSQVSLSMIGTNELTLWMYQNVSTLNDDSVASRHHRKTDKLKLDLGSAQSSLAIRVRYTDWIKDPNQGPSQNGEV